MKKKCLYSLLTILSTIMLIGCNSSEPSEEASEPTSVAQGNALESAFLSDDHFELREESITIEYGTPLSDDISEYVIAKDYAGITCEYEETNSFHNPLDNPGTATFIKEDGQRLTLTVYYTDTTPPTIERTEYTFYTLHPGDNWIVEERGTCRYGGENFDVNEFVFNRSSMIDFFNITDNISINVLSITVDDTVYNYENGNNEYGWDRIEALEYGSHNVIFNVSDNAGHTETFECILHVVAEVSPEEREILISEYGFTEEKINNLVEEFVNQNDI